MKKLLICFMAIAVSGCATKKLTEADEQRIRNVGVVSIIPEDAPFQKIGLTVFNNEKAVIEMNGQFGEAITSVVKTRLSQTRPKWNVKNIEYKQSVLIEKYNSRGMVMVSHLEKIQKDLAELTKNNDLDALVVVFPMTYSHAIHGNGVGVILRTFSVSSIQRGYAHAFVGLTLVDRQGEVMAYEHIGPDKGAKEIDIDGYGIKYSLAANMTPETTDKLKADMTNLLEKNVISILTLLDM